MNNNVLTTSGGLASSLAGLVDVAGVVEFKLSRSGGMNKKKKKMNKRKKQQRVLSVCLHSLLVN